MKRNSNTKTDVATHGRIVIDEENILITAAWNNSQCVWESAL